MIITQHLNQMKPSTFIAIAAVIGGSFLIPVPIEASVWVDLKNNKQLLTNDGDPTVYVTNGHTTTSEKTEKAGYPIAGGKHNARKLINNIPGIKGWASAFHNESNHMPNSEIGSWTAEMLYRNSN